MDAQFWHNVWQKGQLGFQLEQPHELLVQLRSVFAAAPSVFVPLCGKSPDMHLLATSSQVLGVELSEIACRDFFAEAGVIPAAGPLGSLQHGHVTIWPADIFAVEPHWLQPCQHIYDRAALIALPPSMQRAYVTQLKALLPAATMLLLTVDYPQDEMQGPPFAVNAAAVQDLFSDADVQLLAERDLTGQKFARRLLPVSSLREQAWLIHW